MNDAPVGAEGSYILYWMIAARRISSNFALDRAVWWSRELALPLVILEALRVDYPFASDRLHRFVLDGMADNRRALANAPVLYYPYVEPEPGAARGLLHRLARTAAVVVTDDYPVFFLPRMVNSAAARLPVRLEAVDSNGILPMRAAGREFSAAAHFRRHVQKHLRTCLEHWPSPNPFAGAPLPRLDALPDDFTRTWPPAAEALLAGDEDALASLPIDHTVPAVPTRGGRVAAAAALEEFIASKLSAYHDAHNAPDRAGTSRLSPYLHFGHLSAHQVFDAVMRHERWSARRLPPKATGAREGWWQVGRGAEAFLDQLVIWRELAFNGAAMRPDDYDRYEALPDWARRTLAAHEQDPRPHRYARSAFESASTHDPLWNAAARQLRREGWFHNYMRMLWGKKILEWSATPREALATMTAIMDRWSLDGRDPNSYAGYLWTLGRYDRPWPERPVYGTVRSMSSENTARKVAVAGYLARYGEPLQPGGATTPTTAPLFEELSPRDPGRSRRRRG